MTAMPPLKTQPAIPWVIKCRSTGPRFSDERKRATLLAAVLTLAGMCPSPRRRPLGSRQIRGRALGVRFEQSLRLDNKVGQSRKRPVVYRLPGYSPIAQLLSGGEAFDDVNRVSILGNTQAKIFFGLLAHRACIRF